MQGLHGRVFLAMAVAMIATGASAQYADDQAGAPQTFRFSSLSDLRDNPRGFVAPAAAFRPIVYRVTSDRFVKLTRRVTCSRVG